MVIKSLILWMNIIIKSTLACSIILYLFYSIFVQNDGNSFEDLKQFIKQYGWLWHLLESFSSNQKDVSTKYP